MVLSKRNRTWEKLTPPDTNGNQKMDEVYIHSFSEKNRTRVPNQSPSKAGGDNALNTAPRVSDLNVRFSLVTLSTEAFLYKNIKKKRRNKIK